MYIYIFHIYTFVQGRQPLTLSVYSDIQLPVLFAPIHLFPQFNNH
jgi:hypothetical protein